MHARIDRGRVKLITARSGLDWTSKYPETAEALKQLPVAHAYLDGELCAVRPDGTTSFSLMQATDGASAAGLVYFVFDALHLDGEDLLLQPLLERKARLTEVMKRAPRSLQFSHYVIGNGPGFFRQACKLGAEGIVSKRADAPYRPGDRGGSWLKTKCLNREEFIVVGWTDPEGSRPHLGALLLAYYARRGPLVYRARRHRHVRSRAGAARSAPEAACDRSDAARRAAVAYEPLRLAARALPRPLGPAGTRCRSHIFGMDRRWPAPTRCLSGAAGGQAGARGSARSAADAVNSDIAMPAFIRALVIAALFPLAACNTPRQESLSTAITSCDFEAHKTFAPHPFLAKVEMI
jgi:bifunctional non-homologous end joining protein LigD